METMVRRSAPATPAPYRPHSAPTRPLARST